MKNIEISGLGEDYYIDADKAIALGVIVKGKAKEEKKSRPIKFSDLKNGDVFKFRNLNDPFSSSIYIMVNKSLRENGQSIRDSGGNNYTKTWLRDQEVTTFAVYNFTSGKFEETL